jgi:Amt family ammonium transporter
LVAITPASGFVNAQAAILIGLGAGVVCYWAVQLKHRLHVDDALDVFGVHGVGGAWGAIATGLFATVAVNAGGANGLFFGNPGQLLVQLAAVLTVAIYAGAATWLILKLIDVTIGLRVDVREEVAGLDESQHGEAAYQF